MHFNVDSAVLWDRPETRVPIGIVVSDRASYRMADKKGDVMVAVEPRQDRVQMFEESGGSGKPRVGQFALSYDTDRDRAVERAHDQFRWFGLAPPPSRPPPRS
jgi:hypothetical protein